MSSLSLTSMTESCVVLWQLACIAPKILFGSRSQLCMHAPSFEGSMLSNAKIAGRLTCVPLWPYKPSGGAEAVFAGCCLWLSCLGCSVLPLAMVSFEALLPLSEGTRRIAAILLASSSMLAPKLPGLSAEWVLAAPVAWVVEASGRMSLLLCKDLSPQAWVKS